MYSTPKAILPKFLWQPILECLPMTDIYKLDIVSKHFDNILSDNDWKRRFLYGRSSDIAIVKCNTDTMDGFWKHACCYIACASFFDIFTMIEMDNKANAVMNTSKFIYYKVFIKAGIYHTTISTNISCVNHTDCSIEINGSKDNPTIIKFSSSEFRQVILSKYFSIQYITFSGSFGLFTFTGSKDDYLNNINIVQLKYCVFKNISRESLNIFFVRDVIISSCTFENTLLFISTVSKLSITDSIFNGRHILNYH